jgi:hypothetical protein
MDLLGGGPQSKPQSFGVGTANTVVARANAAMRKTLTCILLSRGFSCSWCTFNVFVTAQTKRV